MSYVYILQNKITHKIYIGSTIDLRKRIKYHLRRNKNWVLIYYEAYRSEKDVREREQKLKQYGTSLANLKHRIKYSFLS
jgi:predicted GIY-YIG superfamily endonuclease